MDGQAPLSPEDIALVTMVLANMPGHKKHTYNFNRDGFCYAQDRPVFAVDMPKDDVCTDLGLAFPTVPQYTFLANNGEFVTHTAHVRVAAPAKSAPTPQAMVRSDEQHQPIEMTPSLPPPSPPSDFKTKLRFLRTQLGIADDTPTAFAIAQAEASLGVAPPQSASLAQRVDAMSDALGTTE
jgi:hypothetical protein